MKKQSLNQSVLHSVHQHTLRKAVTCEGIGLHSGEKVALTLVPAAIDNGIMFRRTDVALPRSFVTARYDAVVDTTLGTTIENAYGVSVATIEHLMATLWGMGIDNAVVEINGPEVPIMDGSAGPFVALIESAGVKQQQGLRSFLHVAKTVTVREGKSEITASPAEGFTLNTEIEFTHGAIACQRARIDFTAHGFKDALSRARTFGFAAEVEQLRKAGLARGGSLDNAIVLNEQGVMNKEGLRFDDEFVRHKALDCIGDFYLAGYRIVGEIDALRPGHGINNTLLRGLMEDKTAYRLVRGLAQSAPLSRRAAQSEAIAVAAAPVF